jgi:hypothetical protein
MMLFWLHRLEVSVFNAFIVLSAPLMKNNQSGEYEDLFIYDLTVPGPVMISFEVSTEFK